MSANCTPTRDDTHTAQVTRIVLERLCDHLDELQGLVWRNTPLDHADLDERVTEATRLAFLALDELRPPKLPG